MELRLSIPKTSSSNEQAAYERKLWDLAWKDHAKCSLRLKLRLYLTKAKKLNSFTSTKMLEQARLKLLAKAGLA